MAEGDYKDIYKIGRYQVSVYDFERPGTVSESFKYSVGIDVKAGINRFGLKNGKEKGLLIAKKLSEKLSAAGYDVAPAEYESSLGYKTVGFNCEATGRTLEAIEEDVATACRAVEAELEKERESRQQKTGEALQGTIAAILTERNADANLAGAIAASLKEKFQIKPRQTGR